MVGIKYRKISITFRRYLCKGSYTAIAWKKIRGLDVCVSHACTLGAPAGDSPRVFFDIALDRYGEGTKLGRIVIELKADVAPKTAENYRQLCLAPEGEGFANSRFHRIIPQFMCQGGDFTRGNGTGGDYHASGLYTQ